MERAESPPKTGLSQIFSKNRRGRKSRDSAGNSIKSSNSYSYSGLPSPGEAGDVGKGLEVTEADADAPTTTRLVPKVLAVRRRKKKREREEERRVDEEVERGRTVADRGTLQDAVDPTPDDRAQESSQSFITYDSDTESPPDIAPPRGTHSSHAGYLTTSSPFVHTVTLPEPALLGAQLDGLTPRASTFPNADTLAASASPPILERTLRAPSYGSERRSPSPVGRLKQAFAPKRGSSPNTSPERKSGGLAAGTLKGKVGGDRRGSVASKIGSIFPDKQPSTQSTSSSPERPRAARLQSLDTNAGPSTPPPAEHPAPVIVSTPPTPVDRGTDGFGGPRERAPSDPIAVTSNVVVSPSGSMISHRRIRSGSINLGPSKLSNSTSAPLTPTPENSVAVPGGGGFFSSVFSAAQNAASTLSSSMGNTSVVPGSKRKSVSHDIHDIQEVDSPIVETFTDKPDAEVSSEKKELAVNTLGMGDLSLSALGISEHSGTSTPLGPSYAEESRGRSESAPEDLHRSTPPPGEFSDNVSTMAVDDIQPLFRPRTNYGPGSAGEHTPPNGSVFEGRNVHRSGSMRSAIGKHRKRGSSAATGTTIGAAIAAANNSIANPATSSKITGFAVASKKRNRDFHQLFRSVPDDDYLIEDYSCALQREILAHGRLYVSEGHLCFSSNIFGWVTTLVMSFDEIVSVEKRSTALLFKNGLMISTLHAKNIFASFTSRDSTYDLIVGIWKLGHPSLRSSLNGVSIEETGGGDKTEKYDGNPVPESHSASESESEEEEDGDEIYDEDDEEEEGPSFTQAEGSVVGSEAGEKMDRRKASGAVVTGAPLDRKDDGSAGSPIDFPGPATHAPTDCGDSDTHYAKVIGDDVIQAPLGKVYSLMFGPASITWMRNWLTTVQKCFELTVEESAKKPLSLDNKVRSYSYIKPLNGSIGPKQTKCLCTETLDFLDLEKSVSVTISTQTPDVPSGNVFSTKTKYCLSWAEGNATRLQMNCATEWTGKSWLKGPIEKGANDGQVQFAKAIIASLKTTVSSRRGVVTATPGKGKKKGRKSRETKRVSKQVDGATDSQPATENWGLLEPFHPVLGPLLDILSPLFTGNMRYGILVGLLVASWFHFGLGRSSGRDHGMAYFEKPDRIAAYEEMWRREESELWEWLEDRTGIDRLKDVGSMPVDVRAVQHKLKSERMEEREIEAAIRVTEQRLRALQASVEKRKERASAKAKANGKAEREKEKSVDLEGE